MERQDQKALTVAVLSGIVVLVVMYGFARPCTYVPPEERARWEREERIDDLKRKIEEQELERRLDQHGPKR